MSIGQRIKEARNNKGLTQVQLAERANISRSYLGDLEGDRYNPSIETLKAISKALNIDVAYFLDNSESVKNFNEQNTELNIPDDLKDLMVAFHKGGIEGLTQDEINKIVEIAKIIKSEAKDRSNNKK